MLLVPRSYELFNRKYTHDKFCPSSVGHILDEKKKTGEFLLGVSKHCSSGHSIPYTTQCPVTNWVSISLCTGNGFLSIPRPSLTPLLLYPHQVGGYKDRDFVLSRRPAGQYSPSLGRQYIYVLRVRFFIERL